ncbi:hypothetical protein [Acrocarpospora catenulata]|uniref:hypothetical protein n=1 Tax=Acrocarpospora catenulata TaxID=2836182 RepID=UPI001BDA4B4E|nr:hypothetical protein [Acrocarpospora catenulata]
MALSLTTPMLQTQQASVLALGQLLTHTDMPLVSWHIDAVYGGLDGQIGIWAGTRDERRELLSRWADVLGADIYIGHAGTEAEHFAIRAGVAGAEVRIWTTATEEPPDRR